MGWIPSSDYHVPGLGDKVGTALKWRIQQVELTWKEYAFTQGFSGDSDGKESTCNVEDPGLIPSVEKITWRRECNPLQCSSEKAMAPHSSTLAWKIPWTEEPGRLQSIRSLSVVVLAWRIPGTGEPGGLPSMGSHRVGHD